MRLLMALAEKTNRYTGLCYPGVSTLADEIGVTEQAIRKSRSYLENTGFLHVIPNASNYRTNIFLLDFRNLPASPVKRVEHTGSPEPDVSGSLIGGIFGETGVARMSRKQQELIEFVSGLDESHD